MPRLSQNTFPRPHDMGDRSNPAVLYVQSYLLIRTVVGVLGIVLPLIFLIGEFFIRGSVHVRGSISAYYHTSMRDIFVAGLCVIGFLLATYMSGQTNTLDFWFSLAAGVAVLGVVFFPTLRPGLLEDTPKCGTTPMPEGCSTVQQLLGEDLVAGIHYTCAVVFILSLARIAFLFARREKEFEHNTTKSILQKLCGWAIILAVGWVVVGGFLGVVIWELTPLYLGEVIAVWAFGASWLLKGKDLRGILGLGRAEEGPPKEIATMGATQASEPRPGDEVVAAIEGEGRRRVETMD
jgi:hypothetical protein